MHRAGLSNVISGQLERSGTCNKREKLQRTGVYDDAAERTDGALGARRGAGAVARAQPPQPPTWPPAAAGASAAAVPLSNATPTSPANTTHKPFRT